MDSLSHVSSRSSKAESENITRFTQSAVPASNQKERDDSQIIHSIKVVWNELAIQIGDMNFKRFVIKTDVVASKQLSTEVVKKESKELQDNFTKWMKTNKEALVKKVETLCLHGKAMSTLPDDISMLLNISHLTLTKSHFTKVPSSVCTLVNVTNLFLRTNQLSELPAEFEKLAKLLWLDLSKNKFTVFPPVISKLTKLINLDFHSNKLVYIPSEIIIKLTNLEELGLFDNLITTPPPDIETVVNVKELELKNSDLKVLPKALTDRVSKCKIILDTNLGSQGNAILVGRINAFKFLGTSNETGFDKSPLKCIISGLLFWCEILKPLHLKERNPEVWEVRSYGCFPAESDNSLTFSDFYNSVRNQPEKKDLQAFVEVLRTIKNFWTNDSTQKRCIIESHSKLKKEKDYETKWFDKLNSILTEIYQFLSKRNEQVK